MTTDQTLAERITRDFRIAKECREIDPESQILAVRVDFFDDLAKLIKMHLDALQAYQSGSTVKHPQIVAWGVKALAASEPLKEILEANHEK